MLQVFCDAQLFISTTLMLLHCPLRLQVEHWSHEAQSLQQRCRELEESAVQAK